MENTEVKKIGVLKFEYFKEEDLELVWLWTKSRQKN